jgi:hypothetical protein
VSTRIPGPQCSVGKMLDQLSEGDAAAMKQALANPDTRAVDLSALLRAHGYRIMAHTLRRHRNDQCSCSTRLGAADFTQAGSIEGALALLNNGGHA